MNSRFLWTLIDHSSEKNIFIPKTWRNNNTTRDFAQMLGYLFVAYKYKSKIRNFLRRNAISGYMT